MAVNALLTGRIRKVKADFYSGNGLNIDSVKIDHYHVKLKIRLLKIHEYNDHAVE